MVVKKNIKEKNNFENDDSKNFVLKVAVLTSLRYLTLNLE